MNNKITYFVCFIVLVGMSFAVDFTPQGNINGRNVYSIYGFVTINGTNTTVSDTLTYKTLTTSNDTVFKNIVMQREGTDGLVYTAQQYLESDGDYGILLTNETGIVTYIFLSRLGDYSIRDYSKGSTGTQQVWLGYDSSESELQLFSDDYNGLLDIKGNISGTMSWSNLTNYPASCPANTYLTQLGDSVTCTGISDVYLLNTGDTATGDYNFDSNTFVIDSANDRVGIGTTSPSAKLDVVGDTEITGTQDIINAGTGNGLFIDQNGNGISLKLDTSATTATGFEMYGRGIYTGSSGFARINLEQADSTGDALLVKNDGTGNGLFIDQNGNGDALNIDSEATSGQVLIVDGVSNSYLSTFTRSSDLYTYLVSKADSIGSNWFYRNLAAAETNGAVMFIEQDNAGDDQDALSIQNDGTGQALSLTQNSDARAVNFLSTATTKPVLNIYNNELHTGTGDNSLLKVNMNNAGATGTAMEVDNVGTGIGLNIKQVGAGTGLFIDQNGVGYSLYIDDAGTQGSRIFNTGSALASGRDALLIYSNVAETTGNSLFRVSLDNSGSSISAQEIMNDGTGNGLLIDQNGNGYAERVNQDGDYVAVRTTVLDARGGSSFAYDIQDDSDTTYVHLLAGKSSTSGTNHFYRNLASADTAAPVMVVEQDNAGDDQNALTIQNDGTGASISLTANGAGIEMKSPDGTTYCLTIANGGTTSVSAGACSK